MDQSSFAAPHGLSQRTTSFIACVRQGIHQMPFCHLIALIINAHQVLREMGSMLSIRISLYQCPSLRTDTDVKTRFSSRLTRQRKRLASLTWVGDFLHKTCVLRL
jgi:hypothetical protein